jgi:hypothetical protein
VFPNSEIQGLSGHTDKPNGRRSSFRSPRLLPDGNPDFTRGLSCEVVEAKGGKQTDNSFRELVRCFNESVVLTCREIRRGVKTSVHLRE